MTFWPSFVCDECSVSFIIIVLYIFYLFIETSFSLSFFHFPLISNLITFVNLIISLPILKLNVFITCPFAACLFIYWCFVLFFTDFFTSTEIDWGAVQWLSTPDLQRLDACQTPCWRNGSKCDFTIKVKWIECLTHCHLCNVNVPLIIKSNKQTNCLRTFVGFYF